MPGARGKPPSPSRAANPTSQAGRAGLAARSRLAELDDASLVERLRQGDGRAWETVVLRYRRLVYAIPTRCGLTPEESDEVFQNTFTRLVERLDTIRDPSLVRAWLVTTARRLSLDSAGRRKALPDSEEILATIPDRAPLAAEEVARLEDQHFVRQAFERLPERCRALLDLLYYATDEPSYEAIGQRLGIPVGSIGPTRARCLGKLIRLYREVTGEG